ncbi:MAG: ABC transporter permease [Chloroflexi bacterium]|jgi:osmoprotectant transport system permease protein|nr:MAG: ABC transporter permease [Chloroflexota bacterium]
MNFANQVLQWFLNGAHWQGDGGIPHRTFEHLAMSGASVLTAAVIALPVGIAIGHIGRGGILAINISNIGRAIPSFAVLVIAVELFGIGALPAFIALVALAIPPMVTNSYIGMREVDADVREAARGMGMRERAVLLRVELPIALPFIMAGIRTSAVNVVATATLAALVAWGGLGRFIVDGFGLQDYPMMFAGAIMVAILSLIVEFSLAGAQRLATPAGLRPSKTVQKEEPLGTTRDTAMVAA